VYKEITELLKLERDISEAADNEIAVRTYEILIPKALTRLFRKGNTKQAKDFINMFKQCAPTELSFGTEIGSNWQPVTTIQVGRGGKMSRCSLEALDHTIAAKNNDAYARRRQDLAELWLEIRMHLADDIDFFKDFSDSKITPQQMAEGYS
jgi:hypothetical protein